MCSNFIGLLSNIRLEKLVNTQMCVCVCVCGEREGGGGQSRAKLLVLIKNTTILIAPCS